MGQLLVALAALLLVLTGSSAAAEAERSSVVPLNHLPALAGDYFPLRSRSNGHLYHIYVRLPEGYAAEQSRRYPIVYLLDGDSLFPVVGANHIYLTIDDKLPEAIVVGIAYGSFAKPINRRHIDFMPPGPEESGTETFHRFLETEVLPQVEGRYRADRSKRILFGQSRGGALVLYSAFTKPDLFWARIASNPSWVPGREIFYGVPAPATREDLQLLIAIGTQEYPDKRAAAAEWFRYWDSRNLPWRVTRIDIDDGTHSADAANAYRAALRRLFGLSTGK